MKSRKLLLSLAGLIGLALAACCAVGALASLLGSPGSSPPPKIERLSTLPAELPAIATAAPLPSDTPVPVVVPTATIPVEVRSPPPVEPACDCSGDLYNCPSFGSSYEAQRCFEYCRSIGAGDPHDLDRDGDGVVCEN